MHDQPFEQIEPIFEHKHDSVVKLKWSFEETTALKENGGIKYQVVFKSTKIREELPQSSL